MLALEHDKRMGRALDRIAAAVGATTARSVDARRAHRDGNLPTDEAMTRLEDAATRLEAVADEMEASLRTTV